MNYFHNTSVKRGMPWPLYTSAGVERAVSRNDLFIGTQADYAMEFSPPMAKCDFDYDGFGGGPFRSFAKWARVVYPTLQEFRTNGPVEHHATLVEAATVFASGVRVPEPYEVAAPLSGNDLRLSPKSEAIDAGAVLPNINDGYTGKAPDLGAYEYGTPRPWYGPRSPHG